ncbi:MAG: DUF3570 domain-containing protein [Nevskia sp.]|nr:DUF3570 domain-containing protein [Nevskia sp.]
MQLNGPQRRNRFAAAALSLLGASSAATAHADDGSDWTFDTSTLLYAEGAGRVKVFEPKVNASLHLDESRTLAATVTVDALSGATPNGAAPYSKPQTFFQPHSTSGSSGSSSSSGVNSTYTTAAYELPKDPNFENLRGALEIDYSFAPAAKQHMDLSTALSVEDDYTSIGVGGHWSRDFNQGNTTLGAGLNFSSDFISPVGGVNTPLSQMVGSIANGPSSKLKLVQDMVVGVTQLVSPRSLVQVNYSLSHSNGYLNDPYKILSVVDATAAPLYYVYESRPGSRLKNSLYTHYKARAMGTDVFDASYRYMIDTWGIRSHTVELSYRAYIAGERGYLEPHLRGYRQSAADFFHAALDQGQVAGTRFASADQRLGAFTAYTGGLEYGDRHWAGHDWSVRAEYYRQLGKVEGLPPVAGNALARYDVAPSLSAGWLIFSLGFR